MISRTVRLDPALIDGPVMDRGGVTYVRLAIKPAKMPGPLRVFELALTDRSGEAKRERSAVAIFYDGPLLIAATFVVRLEVRYRDVVSGKLAIVYEPGARRARVAFATEQGALDVTSDVRGPEPGMTREYLEFLEAPPDEQQEVRVERDGTLLLPPARGDAGP